MYKGFNLVMLLINEYGIIIFSTSGDRGKSGERFKRTGPKI